MVVPPGGVGGCGEGVGGDISGGGEVMPMLMWDNYGGGMVASTMVDATAIVGVAMAGGGRW